MDHEGPEPESRLGDVIEGDDRFRVPPAADPATDFFWSSGADGLLRFLRCGSCGYYLHPPGPRCPECGSQELAPEAVSGRGIVQSFTINQQPWDGDPTPYVVALVELVEQAGMRLTTNLLGVDPDEVTIGAPVRVVFEHRHFDVRGDIYFPLFEAADGAPEATEATEAADSSNLHGYAPHACAAVQISEEGEPRT